MRSHFFLKASGLLLIMCFVVMAACKQTVDVKGPGHKVPLLQLDNGKEIPQLGFGTYTLKGDVVRNAVKTAMDNGYRLVDTAQWYENEADVYQGIVNSGVNRGDVFITTKIFPDNMRNRRVRESLEQSLKNLGGDYIDLVLIHWPVQGYIEETWKILEEYVNNGKVLSIGVSNFNPHHIDDLMKYAKIKPVLNQIEIHPYMTQTDVVQYMFDKGIKVQAWSPLAEGTILNDPVLMRLAEKHNKSVAQIILRWHMQRGISAIPRAENPAYIAENINIFDFKLSNEDMDTINALNKNRRVKPENGPDNFPH